MKRKAYDEGAIYQHLYYSSLDRSGTNYYLSHAIDNHNAAEATHLAHLPRNRPLHLYGGMLMKLVILGLLVAAIGLSISSIMTGGASLGLSLAVLTNFHKTIMLASWAALVTSALGTLWATKGVGSSVRSAYLVSEAKSQNLVAREPEIHWIPSAPQTSA
jgi:hypothetical protein